jgi:spore coat protein CotH
MNSLSLLITVVLIYIVNTCHAVNFKVICSPQDYGGTSVSVNIDGKSYPMQSANNDILFELKFDGTPKQYYYEITGTIQNELPLIDNTPRTWDQGSTTTFYEVYGHKYSLGDDIIKAIPRIAQPLEGYDKYSPFFQEGELRVINLHLKDTDYTQLITMTQKQTLNYIIEFDLYTPYEKYHFTNATLDLSGQGSKNDEKKPFKIDLSKNEADKSNSEIFNRSEFKLRNLRNDESYIKNKLVEDIAESMGLPVTQSTLCRLYINNNSYGLYELSDMYKKKFIRRFFNVQKNGDGYVYGSFYKGVSQTNEQDKNIPAYLYPDMEGANIAELYESIVPADPANPHAELNNLISWLNALPDNASKEEIESKFDVEMFLKFMVLEYLICHWDGYLGNGNNFFIYAEPNNGKYHFISYDFDSTLGKWCNSKEGNIDQYVTDVVDVEDRAYGNQPKREPLLYRKILKNPNIEPMFNEIVKETISGVFNIEALGPRIDYFHEFLKQDMYWDIDCLTNGSIKTKGFNKDKELPVKADIDKQFVEESPDTETLKAYIKYKSTKVGEIYGVTSKNTNNKFGTVGGKLMTIGKAKEENDKDSDKKNN